MHLVMFDIDGTLVNSSDFEDDCYLKAVRSVINEPIETNWAKYKHTTDIGILNEIIESLGFADKQNEVYSKVKKSFITHVESYVSKFSVKEIPGASHFLDKLRNRNDVVLAIATGGWEESAKLKLESAGINYRGICFASSADHHIRTEIMKHAQKKCQFQSFSSKTYFGDAIWDKQAALELGYNFVLVGNQINHKKQIPDFNDIDRAMSLIGL